MNTMLCEKEKTKNSIQIVQDIQFNKKNFQIKDHDNSFRIQFRDNDGKKIHFQRRYGKRKTKEQALEEINEIKRNLSQEYNSRCETVVVEKNEMVFKGKIDKPSNKREEDGFIVEFD